MQTGVARELNIKKTSTSVAHCLADTEKRHFLKETCHTKGNASQNGWQPPAVWPELCMCDVARHPVRKGWPRYYQRLIASFVADKGNNFYTCTCLLTCNFPRRVRTVSVSQTGENLKADQKLCVFVCLLVLAWLVSIKKDTIVTDFMIAFVLEKPIHLHFISASSFHAFFSCVQDKTFLHNGSCYFKPVNNIFECVRDKSLKCECRQLNLTTKLKTRPQLYTPFFSRIILLQRWWIWGHIYCQYFILTSLN